MRPHLLIIDDEPAICTALTMALEDEYEVIAVTNANEGLQHLKETATHLVLLDLVIGLDDGVEVLQKIKEIDSSIVVIMMTAHGSIRSSVNAMKCGAFTYLSKPFDLEELYIYIRQALEFRMLSEKVSYLNDELKVRYQYGEMVGKSPKMQDVYRIIDKVKDVDASVMIYGESGTGKELVARAMQSLGKRKDEMFVVVNCAAIPEGLLEEEFFGHKKGAFTGAVSDKIGKLELADKGTIFLDEIGDMPLALQGKLLRVLQQKEFTPIGSNIVRKIDVRVIAATHRNLYEMIQNGTFRQDLFFRLNIVEITLPPLRERKQDIPILSKILIEKISKEYNKNVLSITKEAEQLLLGYDYPGNIRELENALEYASIFSSKEMIDVDDLPGNIRREVHRLEEKNGESESFQFLNQLTMREIEKLVIELRLKKNNGKRKSTAEELGISERGLRNKIQEYEIED